MGIGKNVFVMVGAFVSILLLMVARHHLPTRRKIRQILHGRVYWEGEANTTLTNKTLLRSSTSWDFVHISNTGGSATEFQHYCPHNLSKLQNLQVKWRRYRFTDALKGYYFSQYMKNPMTRETLLKYYEKFGSTLVSQYFNKTKSIRDLGVLNFLLRPKLKNLPNNTAVIHLRLGDTSCLECWKKLTTYKTLRVNTNKVYVYPETYYQQIIQKISKENISTIVIVAATYHAVGDMKAIYEDSMKYVKLLRNLFIQHGYRVVERINCGTPDEDFIYMTSAKYFVPGGGGFSRTIGQLVARNGGKVFVIKSE